MKSVLESEGVANPDILAQKIMDRLVQWQREIALEGSEKAPHLKKRINWTTVRKQLAAGIDMTMIAASQKVSEGTLRRRMKEEGIFDYPQVDLGFLWLTKKGASLMPPAFTLLLTFPVIT